MTVNKGNGITLNGQPIDFDRYDGISVEDYVRHETFRGHAYGGDRSGQTGTQFLRGDPRVARKRFQPPT